MVGGGEGGEVPGEEMVAAADGADGSGERVVGEVSGPSAGGSDEQGAHGAAGDQEVLDIFEARSGGVANGGGGVGNFAADELTEFFEVGFEEPEVAGGGDAEALAAGIDDDLGALGDALIEKTREIVGSASFAETTGEDDDVGIGGGSGWGGGVDVEFVEEFLCEEAGFFGGDGEAAIAEVGLAPSLSVAIGIEDGDIFTCRGTDFDESAEDASAPPLLWPRSHELLVEKLEFVGANETGGDGIDAELCESAVDVGGFTGGETSDLPSLLVAADVKVAAFENAINSRIEADGDDGHGVAPRGETGIGRL